MRPVRKSVLVLAALGAAALAAASYGAYWWHTGRFMQTTDDAYVGGDISAISSKVSGYIQQLAVQDNMAVKKGDLLIRIDDRDYRAALAKAAGEVAAQQAALADIQATRQLQQATIAGSAASLLAATAATEKLANDNRRYNALAASSAISAQIRDNASADYRRAHAEQEKAKADKTVAERQLAVLDARHQQILAALAQAQANLEMARLNLSYTDIRAPFDGVIGNRRAWSGSFVSSGTQLLSLVPAHGLWIDANFKETSWRICVPASRRPSSPMCCRTIPLRGMSPAWRRRPAHASAFCRRRTRPGISLKSCSGCRSALRWKVTGQSLTSCARDCR
ncbi:HlyD family secretion protein [Klebsiella pneumoniae]|nr:HlyD family secretion protein [Klebsiella pneumoniae]